MTMTTYVYVLDEMRAKDVFLKCNQLIGANEHTETVHEQKKAWRKGERFVEPGSPWWFWNRPGQGLCALMDVEYRPGEPYRTAAQAAECEDYCNADCSKDDHEPACWLEVSLDTAYGWRGPNDEKCGDLHARIVEQLGRWLDERGIHWVWRNDHHTGTFSGYDQLPILHSRRAA